MLDDVEFRELRIFLAVLAAAMRETGAQRPAAAIRAGCPLPWPALSQADHQHGSAINSEISLHARAADLHAFGSSSHGVNGRA